MGGGEGLRRKSHSVTYLSAIYVPVEENVHEQRDCVCSEHENHYVEQQRVFAKSGRSYAPGKSKSKGSAPAHSPVMVEPGRLHSL